MSQVDGNFLKLHQARYGKASRKEKSHILDEFIRTTGSAPITSGQPACRTVRPMAWPWSIPPMASSSS